MQLNELTYDVKLDDGQAFTVRRTSLRRQQTLVGHLMFLNQMQMERNSIAVPQLELDIVLFALDRREDELQELLGTDVESWPDKITRICNGIWEAERPGILKRNGFNADGSPVEETAEEIQKRIALLKESLAAAEEKLAGLGEKKPANPPTAAAIEMVS